MTQSRKGDSYMTLQIRPSFIPCHRLWPRTYFTSWLKEIALPLDFSRGATWWDSAARVLAARLTLSLTRKSHTRRSLTQPNLGNWFWEHQLHRAQELDRADKWYQGCVSDGRKVQGGGRSEWFPELPGILTRGSSLESPFLCCESLAEEGALR